MPSSRTRIFVSYGSLAFNNKLQIHINVNREFCWCQTSRASWKRSRSKRPLRNRQRTRTNTSLWPFWHLSGIEQIHWLRFCFSLVIPSAIAQTSETSPQTSPGRSLSLLNCRAVGQALDDSFEFAWFLFWPLCKHNAGKVSGREREWNREKIIGGNEGQRVGKQLARKVAGRLWHAFDNISQCHAIYDWNPEVGGGGQNRRRPTHRLKHS